MIVTNEQAEVLVICSKYDCCEECEKYEEVCPLLLSPFITQESLAYDLLEARKLIKEMREELREVLVSREHEEAKEMVFITNFTEIESILERTKEYQ